MILTTVAIQKLYAVIANHMRFVSCHYIVLPGQKAILRNQAHRYLHAIKLMKSMCLPFMFENAIFVKYVHYFIYTTQTLQLAT